MIKHSERWKEALYERKHFIPKKHKSNSEFMQMCIICDFSSKQTITRVFCLFLAVFLSPRTLYREQESSANMLSRCDVVEFTHRLFCFSLRSSNFLYTYSNIILCKYCAGLSSFYSMALYMVVIDIGYMWMKLKILLIFFLFHFDEFIGLWNAFKIRCYMAAFYFNSRITSSNSNNKKGWAYKFHGNENENLCCKWQKFTELPWYATSPAQKIKIKTHSKSF